MTEATRLRREIGIRKITRADVEQATDVMARAFDDDPLMNYLAKQDEKRSERIRLLMRMALTKLTFPFGETYIA